MNKIGDRNVLMQNWLNSVLDQPFKLEPMPPGAGLRRYSRIEMVDKSFVVMDSPPDGKCLAFIQLSQSFLELGIHVPKVYETDLKQGFLLLSDLGKKSYFDSLNSSNADRLYRQAFTALLRIQSYSDDFSYRLPKFDMKHYREKMDWFLEFYFQKLLDAQLAAADQKEFESLFDLLIETSQEQPQVCVHYDYHSRNLMDIPQITGVLDFQDAVLGPLTYDLMSLLRDCYIDWPSQHVRDWMEHYRCQVLSAGILKIDNPQLWLRWCDFSSLQRHIKCIGLFARFHVLGHSSDYLQYIPRSLNYLREVSLRYPEMVKINNLLEKIK